MMDVIVDLLASRAKYHNFFPLLYVFFCFNRKFCLDICIADMPETTWHSRFPKYTLLLAESNKETAGCGVSAFLPGQRGCGI